MTRNFKYILVVSCGVLAACATAVRGTNDQISIDTQPQGAQVTLSNGETCTTPCLIKAKRNKSLQVSIKKDGCLTATRSLVPTLAGSGVILGGLIDYGTGAVYDLQPNPLFIELNCNNISDNVK